MKSDTISQILVNSDKAELLDGFTKALETASRVVVMFEEPSDTGDDGTGSIFDYLLLGFKQLYEVDGFVRQLHKTIMED